MEFQKRKEHHNNNILHRSAAFDLQKGYHKVSEQCVSLLILYNNSKIE